MSDNYSSLPLVIESLEDNNVITLYIILGTTQATLFYSTDNVTYDSIILNYTTDIITLNAGEKLYIDSFIVEGYRNLLDCGIKFLTTGKFNVYGNLDNVSTSYHVKDGTYSNVMPFLFSKSKVVDAENLSMAHSFGDYAYYMMFNDCKYLRSAPSLPATNLTPYCYAKMFYWCKDLDLMPNLPATTLAPYCYMGMFRSCDGMITVPKLPATTLAEGCYFGMFADCDKIRDIVNVAAKTLDDYCYDYMFYNCETVDAIHARMTEIPNKKNTYNWTLGVKDRGVFTLNSHATWEKHGPHYIPDRWSLNYDGNTDYANMPLTIETEGFEGMGAQIGVQFNEDTTYVELDIIYNEGEDDEDEQIVQLSNSNYNIITLPQFHDRLSIKKITVRNNQDIVDDWGTGFSFTSTKPINVMGNIRNTILSYEYSQDTYTHFAPYLFSNAPVLNANHLILDYELEPYCYTHMFSGCIKLLSAPYLSATKLEAGCYSNMFKECVKMKYSPELFATTLNIACYNSMFKKCSSLLYPPTLPATTLAISCYNEMFSGCTSLQICPVLPAKTMKSSCYQRMFEGCTSIKNPPSLLATTLASDCYSYMFAYCSSLSSMPELLATTLMTRCYNHMFSNCVSLIYTAAFSGYTLATDCCANMFDGCIKLLDTPQLVSTTLANGCYSGMFANCKSLTTARALPATTLKVGCYRDMYKGCENLTTAPILPATTSEINCYPSMFNGCRKINYIKCLMLDEPDTMFSTDWLKNVAETGTFVKNINAFWDVRGANGVPVGWNIEYIGTLDYANEYLIIESLEDDNIIEFGMTAPHEGLEQYAKTIYYSTDKTNWHEASSYGPEVWWRTKMATLNKGDRLLLKGNNATYYTDGYGDITKIFTTKKFKLYGNVMSLFYGDNFAGQTAFDNHTWRQLRGFFSDTLVVDASNLILPATTLVEGCYDSLFLNCEELIATPTLPATTLKQSCYASMFQGCSKLTTPPVLPATTLARSCYEKMFMNCTALTTAPELSVTTLSKYCYRYMFNGCTSLTSAPTLPALTLTEGCYDHMLYNCNNLNNITMLATDISASNCLYYWVYGVSATGTFTKDADTTIPTGDSGIPTGWAVIDI